MQVACMREKTPPLCRMRFPGQEFASQQGLGPTRMQVLPPRHPYLFTVGFQYSIFVRKQLVFQLEAAICCHSGIPCFSTGSLNLTWSQ